MASEAKIAANRRNAQRSTGPRSTAGKARTRRNALVHGLSTPAGHDEAELAQIDELAYALAPSQLAGHEEGELGLLAAEAQVELLRVRRAKVDLVNRAADQVRGEDAGSSPRGERAIMAFAQKAKTLAAFDRYERRALSRRNRALRELRVVQRLYAIRIKKFEERVGPPRPKQRPRYYPFVEWALPLELSGLLKAAVKAGLEPPTEVRFCDMVFVSSWTTEQKTVVKMSTRIQLWCGWGLLELRVHGQAVTQTFVIAHMPTKLGIGKWLIKCPETHKWVRELFAAPDEWRFRSRHTLTLTYRSNTADRGVEQYDKMLARLGANDHRDLPPRPKYMHRRTYFFMCEDIRGATKGYYQRVLPDHKLPEQWRRRRR